MTQPIQPTPSKEYDYDYIVRTIDSVVHLGHVDAIYIMINLFNEKWKPKNATRDITETTELRGILKYKIKKLNQNEIFE